MFLLLRSPKSARLLWSQSRISSVLPSSSSISMPGHSFRKVRITEGSQLQEMLAKEAMVR